MVAVAEATWQDVIDGNLPNTSHKQRFEQAVLQAASAMDALPFNDNKGKLQGAMDLVLAGNVQLHEDGLYSVKDSTKTYDIDGECPCPQGQRQVSKWCKHLVATELWKRVQMCLYPIGASNGQTWVDKAKQNPPVNGSQPQPSHIPEQFISTIHGKQFVH